MAETEGEPFHGVDAISGLPLDDLKPNTPHIAPDDGFPLPHGFGDCEPKSFLEGFLNHHSGRPLEGVDGPMGIRGEDQDVHMGKPFRCEANFLEDRFPLWIVRSPSSRQDQLQRSVFHDEAAGFDNPQRIFEVVEPGHLHHQGQLAVQAKAVENRKDLFFR